MTDENFEEIFEAFWDYVTSHEPFEVLYTIISDYFGVYDEEQIGALLDCFLSEVNKRFKD